jgi:hypothetical protein
MSPSWHPVASGDVVRKSKLLALAPIIKVATLMIARETAG